MSQLFFLMAFMPPCADHGIFAVCVGAPHIGPQYLGSCPNRFGFKLNEANDVRPSSVVFVKGRTPNEDLLLLGGTTRRGNDDHGGGDDGGRANWTGSLPKLCPPRPPPWQIGPPGPASRTRWRTRASTPPNASITVTAICLPPPDIEGVTTQAFVVGSTASLELGSNPSMAYILKMRLDDLSTV